MAQSALIWGGVWFVTMFVVRDLIHRRRTGRSGIMPPARGLSARARLAGVLFVLSLPLALLGPVLELRGVLEPLWDTSARGAQLAAAVVFAVGWLGTFVCQLAMGDSWRIGIDRAQRTELVTGGPYAFVRNPIYSFVMLSALALVAAVPNAASITALLLIVVGFELWVRGMEEPFLIEQHGAKFVAYSARVGRFVPGFGKLRAP